MRVRIHHAACCRDSEHTHTIKVPPALPIYGLASVTSHRAPETDHIAPMHPCLAQTENGSDKFFPTSCRDGSAEGFIRSLSLGDNLNQSMMVQSSAVDDDVCHRSSADLAHASMAILWLKYTSYQFKCSSARSLSTRHTQATTFLPRQAACNGRVR